MSLDQMVESMVLRMRFAVSLEVIETKRPSAGTQGKGACCSSANCCWRRPGGLEPDDVPKIAKFLGITKRELFSTLLVVDELGEERVLLPARAHQVTMGLTGIFLPWRETYSLESPCVFLDEQNKCKIHEVKPKQCREFECWNPERANGEPVGWTVKQLKSLGWDGKDDDE